MLFEMRWEEKLKPAKGEERIIRRFLFLPKCLLKQYGTSKLWRWLERATIKQQYISGHDHYGSRGYWINVHWEDV